MFKGLRNKIVAVFVISIMSLGFLFHFSDNDISADEGKIYICNCPGGCLCDYETNKSGGRCVCGLATIPSDREPYEDLEYECACGTDVCDCGSRSDEPGPCHCGYTEMKEKE